MNNATDKNLTIRYHVSLPASIEIQFGTSAQVIETIIKGALTDAGLRYIGEDKRNNEFVYSTLENGDIYLSESYNAPYWEATLYTMLEENRSASGIRAALGHEFRDAIEGVRGFDHRFISHK